MAEKRSSELMSENSSKKAKAIDDEEDKHHSINKSKKLSVTARELLDVTKEQALRCMQKLIDGHVPLGPDQPGHQPTAKGWAPAIRTPSGCLLAQKAPSRVGY